MNNLFMAWLSGRTVRKHTMHVTRRENIAEHTWGALLLLVKYFPSASKSLHVAVTLHDVGESGVCDMPLHVFDSVPELKGVVQEREDACVRELLSVPQQFLYPIEGLTEDERLIVDVVDRAEFVLSCLYEYEMGNRLVLRPLFHGLEKAKRSAGSVRDTELADGCRLLLSHLTEITHSADKLYKEMQYG